MPAAIPLVAAISVGAAGASALTSAVVIGVASIVAGVLQKSMTRRPGQEERGARINTRSTTEALGIPYGRCRVWGNEVFIEATGTSNRYLWIVQTLGEGECEGLHQVAGVDQVFLNDQIYTDFGDVVSYWFHGGSDTQNVNSDLATAFPKWTDTMRNTCYMVYRLTYNLDRFQSLPSRSCVIKGRKVYDPRDSSTAWTDNAALILFDYLTNQRFGRRWPTNIIDEQSVIDAANYCDAKGWKYNKLVQEWNSQDVVEDMLTHFRGAIIWSEGLFHFRCFDTDYETSVFTITDEHIYQDASNRAQLVIGQPSRWTKPDTLSCEFTDPGKHYTSDFLAVPSTAVGGIVEEIDLSGYLEKETVGKMGTYLLERALLDRSVSGLYRDDLWVLEPGDLITHSSTALYFDDQLMRVQEVSPSEAGVALSLLYESAALYDDVFNLVPEDIYTCNLPDPLQPPPGVINVAVTERVVNWRLRSATNLEVYFETPADYPWFDHVEVWRSWDDTDYDFLFYAGSSFTIDNIEEGRNVWLVLVAVSIHGAKQTFNNGYKISHTVGGASLIVPPSLSALQIVVAGSTVNLFALQLPNADIDQYVFRMGSSWVGSLLLAATKAPNYSAQGVKPGSHTFWVNTFGTSTLWGNVPRSAVATLIDPPPGFTVAHTETDDFSTGTHDNTEQTTYNTEDYLAATRVGGSLSGNYKSPIFDLTEVGSYIMYVLADIAVIGQGTDWNSIAPDPTTWTQLGLGMRWLELIELPAGPNVRMKVNYGETSGLGQTVERMEIMMASVNGRYFQIEIDITDPTAEVFALVQNLTIKWCD